MKKERLFQVIGMIEDNWIKEAEDDIWTQKKWTKKLLIFQRGSGQGENRETDSQMQLPVFQKWRLCFWKWAAVMAGLLLIIGAGVLYQSLYRTLDGTIPQNAAFMKTSDEGMLADGEKTGAGADSKEEEAAFMADEKLSSEEDGEKDKIESLQSSSVQKTDLVVLYAAIIAELYQPYQNKILYLNIEDGLQLEEGQKNTLLELLNVTYGITVETGRFAELCERGVIDAEAKEISGIYLSFQIIKEEEDYMTFQIDGWGGIKDVFCWRDGSAFYKENGWTYELGTFYMGESNIKE